MTQETLVFGRDRHDDGLEVLTFDLQGETFAIKAILVREVLESVSETPVPNAPPFVASIANFRGRIIPVADLRLAFDLKAEQVSSDSRVIVIDYELEGEQVLIGLRADRVYEVKVLQPNTIEATPKIGMHWRQDFISGIAKHNSDIIILPNLENIFAARGAVSGKTYVH